MSIERLLSMDFFCLKIGMPLSYYEEVKHGIFSLFRTDIATEFLKFIFHFLGLNAPCKGERHQTALRLWYSELYLSLTDRNFNTHGGDELRRI